MLDAVRYRQELSYISSNYLVALRMKEYLTYAPLRHNYTYREAMDAANKDLGLVFAPTPSSTVSGLDEWFEKIWESWEYHLGPNVTVPRRMFLLAAEAGLVKVDTDSDLPDEIWEWLKDLDYDFYNAIQTTWTTEGRTKFMHLLRMGWEVAGENGALICIKPHFINTYEMLNNAATNRELGKKEHHAPGQCPTCANPRCTGPHSFFHLM